MHALIITIHYATVYTERGGACLYATSFLYTLLVLDSRKSKLGLFGSISCKDFNYAPTVYVSLPLPGEFRERGGADAPPVPGQWWASAGPGSGARWRRATRRIVPLLEGSSCNENAR